MKKKLMMLATALGFSVAMLTGCGKPTVESLVDGMYDNEVESQTAEVEMDIALSMAAQGFSFDISMGGNMEAQVTGVDGKDGQTMYIDGKISMSVPAASVDEDVAVKVYGAVDGETVTTYTYDESADEWYKTETEVGASNAMDEDTINEMTEAMKDVLKENAELAEDTEEVEGEECYVLTATIAGEDFAGAVKPIQGMIDDAMKEAMEELNSPMDINFDLVSWSEYLSADVTYYISKDSNNLVKSEIDLSGTDVLGMFGQIIKDIGGEEALGDVLDMVEDISFSKFSISVVYSDMNETEVTIPDDVIDNAVDLSEAGVIDDIIGGGDDPIVPDPDPVEPDDPDPVDPVDPVGNNDTITLYKLDASSEVLCEVSTPDGYTYDSTYSTPESGLISYDREDGNGWIWVQNEVEAPMYYSLLNDGVLPVDEYPELEELENYQFAMEVVGTALGGSDVIVALEAYDLDGSSYTNIYICIEYNDGGYKEFLAVDLNNIYNIDEWSRDDFLDLAVDLFGR